MSENERAPNVITLLSCPFVNPLLSCEHHLNPKHSSFKFSSILVQDVREAVNKVKTSKGFGIDGISSYFLKLLLSFIEHSLVLMLNKFLGTASFPDSWKSARVTPIFKDGKKDEKSNYRPISILPVVSKLFERMVFNQLFRYLNSNSVLYKSQSDFRQFFSTTSFLLVNVNDWCKRIDTGHHIGSVFIDLKRAFETVDQSILCEKLIHYGIQHREIKWLRSYLSNRKQLCVVGGVNSEVNYVKVGVPQGSCLGPLLFLVYVNDLPCSVKNSNVSMYADDTRISYKSNTLTQLNEAMNDDLISLEYWLKGNKISLNVTKTHTMLICSKYKQRALINSNENLTLKSRMKI